MDGRHAHIAGYTLGRYFRRTAATREPTCFVDLLFAHKYLPITSIIFLTASNSYLAISSFTFNPSISLSISSHFEQNIIPSLHTVFYPPLGTYILLSCYPTRLLNNPSRTIISLRPNILHQNDCRQD